MNTKRTEIDWAFNCDPDSEDAPQRRHPLLCTSKSHRKGYLILMIHADGPLPSFSNKIIRAIPSLLPCLTACSTKDKYLPPKIQRAATCDHKTQANEVNTHAS